MSEPEKTGLESAAVFVLSSGDPISPATITFIDVPDYSHTGSGTVVLSGSSQSRASISKNLDSSWSILGTFKSGFLSEWEVGDGEYYWYRIEGSCGQSRCDTTGIAYNNCQKMTFVTVVGARNLTELCQNLSNPIINPRVDFRLSSIKKYSRPFERSSSDNCNTLDEQEFCNVAECLNYCLDQDVTQKISLFMLAIESSFFAEMTGGFGLSGRAETDRNKTYDPEFPTIGFSGTSQYRVCLTALAGQDAIVISGNSEISSDHYSLASLVSFDLGGFSRTVSPSRNYSGTDGALVLGGGAGFMYLPVSSGTINLSGLTVKFFRMRFGFSGGIDLGGRLVGYTSPSFFHNAVGGPEISGSGFSNLIEKGVLSDTFAFRMSAFGFGSESFEPDYSSGLTIADQNISPSCGCGPLSLSLTLRHNMANSSYLSSFLRRSGLSISDSVPLRYRSADSSWRFSQNLSGKGMDGNQEDISMFYSMSCSDGFWKFSFSAVNTNRSIGKELHTRFIIDVPADLICSDGSISTTIGLDIKNGGFNNSIGNSISAVTPPRLLPRNPLPRSVDVYVDGVFNDKRIYYDDIGLFKNDYWNNSMLEISINTPPGTKMPVLEIYRIFS